jgi:hypothetical protein
MMIMNPVGEIRVWVVVVPSLCDCVHTDSAEKEKASYFKNISFRPKNTKPPFLQTLKCKTCRHSRHTHSQR